MVTLYVKKLIRIRAGKAQFEFMEYEQAQELWAKYMEECLALKISFIDYQIKGYKLYKDFEEWVDKHPIE